MNQTIQKVMSQLQEQSLALVFSGKSPIKTMDQSYPFQVSKNFYYATKLAFDDLVLVMIKGVTSKVILYTAFKDPVRVKWEGPRPSVKHLKEVSEIDDVRDIVSFEDDIKALLSTGREALYGTIKHVYVDFPVKERLLSHELNFSQTLLPQYPELKIEALGPIFRDLRTLKQPHEIEAIKQAIHITKQGLDVLLKEVKFAEFESDLHAVFDYVIHKNGSKEAFDTIAASGKHATVLHYIDNDQPLDKEGLILLDLGATYEEYNADISRTYPVSGRFTPRQKVLYQMVLDVNKEMIAYVKPGVTMQAFKDEGKRLLAEKALAIGLIKNLEDISRYYYHGLGHHLGLDVHDLCDNHMVFTPGMVITVEPGIYIEEESIGIRIEDDVLVTEDGSVNLSSAIIKEIKDIELFMSK